MSSPLLIAVSGDGSNSGKTTLGCALVHALKKNGPVAALKISTATPDHRCGRTGEACGCLQFEGRMRIMEQDCATTNPKKDTGRYLQAGASVVHWLQATPDTVDAAYAIALAGLKETSPQSIVVEGSAALRHPETHLRIAVMRPDRPSKAGFHAYLQEAQAVVLSTLNAPDSDPTAFNDLRPQLQPEASLLELRVEDDDSISALAQNLVNLAQTIAG